MVATPVVTFGGFLTHRSRMSSRHFDTEDCSCAARSHTPWSRAAQREARHIPPLVASPSPW